MKNEDSELFAPHFAEDVKRVPVNGWFDPKLEIWVGERGAHAGVTFGDPTCTYVLHGTSGPATNFFGSPDPGIPDDWASNDPDPGDPDFC